MVRVAVCLSGCGYLDGSEIHEAVCTLLALDQAGAEAVCCALDWPQAEVVDHGSQSPVEGERRNMLTESARIARGKITDLARVSATEVDALIFPGGFGAAKNLCSFATEGANCRVHPDVERLVNAMVDAGKPIGAICIAPALIARILGRRGLHPTLTIGNEPQTAAALERMGARHQPCAADERVVDRDLRVASTPAYMLASGPAEVYAGVSKLVQDVLRLVDRD